MNTKKDQIGSFWNRIAFIAVLLAMLLQPALHVLDFAFETSFDGIALEMLEDADEKEVEEEGEFEQAEFNLNESNEYQSSVVEKSPIPKQVKIIWAFSPETHIPPPERLS